jgi:hypothetical protein
MLHGAEWYANLWMFNRKGCRRTRSWPNSRQTYCPGICPKGPRKTTKNLGHDSRFASWDLNPESTEYEGALSTRPRRSVREKHLTLNIILLDVAEWDYRVYTGRLFERLPQIVRPFRRKLHTLLASDRLAHIRFRGMVDKPTAYTHYSSVSVSPQWIAEQLGSLCVMCRPTHKPRPHVATATVFGL